MLVPTNFFRFEFSVTENKKFEKRWKNYDFFKNFFSSSEIEKSENFQSWFWRIYLTHTNAASVREHDLSVPAVFSYHFIYFILFWKIITQGGCKWTWKKCRGSENFCYPSEFKIIFGQLKNNPSNAKNIGKNPYSRPSKKPMWRVACRFWPFWPKNIKKIDFFLRGSWWSQAVWTL